MFTEKESYSSLMTRIAELRQRVSDLESVEQRCKSLENEVIKGAKEYVNTLKIIESQANRLDSIIRNMKDGVLVLDIDNNIMMMNYKCEQIFDIKFSDCVGWSLNNVVTNNNLLNQLLKIIHTPTHKRENERIFSFRGTDNKLSHYIVNLANLQDAENATIGKIINLFDQTDKINIENMRKAFLNNVSHEMRTPLTSMISLLEALEATEDTAEQAQFIELMKTANNRLYNLVTNVFDFTQLENKIFSTQNEEFLLGDLCSDCIKGIKEIAKEKNLTLRCENNLPAKTSYSGDSNALKKAILNLLDNAVRFTDHGSITLSVNEHRLGSSNISEILIIIQDTGIGIKKETLSLIAEEFVQADQASTRPYTGIGLGLTISKNIIELMNGKMWIISSPGKGTSCYLAFKLNCIVDYE